MTEGRGTGIPTIRREMARNGSPDPRFETDENYSYFITTLPIHPAFLLRDEVHEGVIKERQTGYNQIDNILRLIHEGVNANIYDIINILSNAAGLNAVETASRTKRGLSTIERYLRLLRKKEVIEFRGAPKTGGYYLTEKAKSNLR